MARPGQPNRPLNLEELYRNIGVPGYEMHVANSLPPWYRQDVFERLTWNESKGRPSAYNLGSKAAGAHQFIPKTWRGLVGQGLAGGDPHDPNDSLRANISLMTQNFERVKRENPGISDDAALEKSVQAYHGGWEPENWGPVNRGYTDYVMNGPAGTIEEGTMAMDPSRHISPGGVTEAGGDMDSRQTPEEMMASMQMVQAQQQRGQMRGRDKFSSFLSGMAMAPHTPYSGGLQQIANMFAGGSAQMSSDMAEMRKGAGLPNSVKEFEYAKNNAGYEGTYTEFKDQFGGNALLKAMAGQQAAAIKADETNYQREQDARKEGVAGEKEQYKRDVGTMPAGYETYTVGADDGTSHDILRPRVGTPEYTTTQQQGDILSDAYGDVSRLRELTAEHGSEIRGEVAGEMKSIRRKILQRLAQAWQMGALGDQEYEKLKDSIPDPGSASSYLVPNEEMLMQFDVFMADYKKQWRRKAKQFEDWGYESPWDKVATPINLTPEYEGPDYE